MDGFHRPPATQKGLPFARDPYEIEMAERAELRETMRSFPAHRELRQSLQDHIPMPDISLDAEGRSSSTTTELVDRRNGEYLVQPAPVEGKLKLQEMLRAVEMQEGGSYHSLSHVFFCCCLFRVFHWWTWAKLERTNC